MNGSKYSELRGHPTYWDGLKWRYQDNGALTEDEWRSRPCGYCGLHNTADGHDGCIGKIRGAKNACCGHGSAEDAYIQYLNGSEVRGKQALQKFRTNESNPMDARAASADRSS